MSKIIKQRERGSLIVVSGPSGCGKGTVIQEFLKSYNEAWLSISCTSREPRPGDIPNESYFFISREEFEEKIKKDEFLEYAEYNGNYYGTPKEHIEEKLTRGIDVILEIEVQGALKVKEIVPEAICIFIMPPSMKELKKRLVGRGTESKEKVLSRFKTAYQEINNVTKYNYVVTNDDVESAVLKMSAILLSEKCRVDRIEEVYLNNEEEEIHELLMDDIFINEDIKI
ncbi:MAG: guanylate kinase [Candidatus Coprovivens sp.]